MKYTNFLIALYFAIINSCSPVVQADEVAGALNPLVSQENITSTICSTNWTRSIRPPTTYTNKIKKQQMAAAGIAWTKKAEYQEDHWVSLGIGGSPVDASNLVLMPYKGTCNAKDKDRLEDKLRALVCAKKISLTTAQVEMQYNWHDSYRRRIGPLVCN